MLHRFLAVLGLASTLFAAMLLTPTTAVAQDQGQTYFTYVSEWAVPRAQWASFENQEASGNATLRKLVADGTIVDWGEVTARVHQEDGYTHADWFTAASRAALLKALEVQYSTAVNPAYIGATKHYDLLLHTIVHNGKTVSDATGYLRVASYQTKAGDGAAFEALFTKSMKPMLDSAVADGTLLMYNFDVEDIHTSAPGAYNLAMLFPNGEAMDKFYANVTAAEKSDPTLGQFMDNLTIGKEHRDTLSRVRNYQHQ